ncbi:unnamed protein product [Cyclocybe aegerita]|uniref:Glucanase n=1 Tax=Cyclocybe aegerita TaxID=1973307 RepID=A0A8S0W176_CYCAE|nr:unnamed protein product [Cyclocybe aegerita]
MFPKFALLSLSITAITAQAQLNGGCQTVSSSVILDSNWCWVHTKSGYTNCYMGNTWDKTLCPNNQSCATNCALEGADYSATYSITTSSNTLTLKFIQNNSNGKNIGSRLPYGERIKLPCGLNGVLYFSAMDEDGGMARFSTNKAGTKYGTGYCNSQCPQDIKFINGEANADRWEPSSNDSNAGNGGNGICCNEMDVWEANSIFGTSCGGQSNHYGSICDPNGCDFNSFRMGDKSFYGPGLKVNTNSKFTVVTQFITDTGTASGTLKEIRRLYVQNGRIIQNSKVNVPGMAEQDSVTTQFCNEAKAAFGDRDSFGQHGGMSGMSKSMAVGMVLVLSIWDDHTPNMLWLDSNYPTDANPNKLGIARGTCVTSSDIPAEFGDIGWTYSGTA